MTDTCDATNRNGEPCGLPAGWGTDHVGEGRCKLHGGASPTGKDNPAFKHGLFSDHLDEEDRDTVDALDEYGDVEKMDELINWRLARLRRYLRETNDEDTEQFFEKFDRLVQEGRKNGEPGLSAKQIRELGKTLNRNNQALQQEIDLVRRLIKDRNKVAGDDGVGGSLRDLFGGGNG